MYAERQQRSAAPLVPGLYANFLPPQLVNCVRIAFGYGNDVLPLAAGGTATSSVGIEADSHFLAAFLNVTIRDNNAPPVLVPAAAVTVQIRDAGSGRNMFNRAVDVGNWFGNAQLPGVMPYPFLVQRNSTISTTWTNNQGVALQVRWDLVGFKIFPDVSVEQWARDFGGMVGNGQTAAPPIY